MEKSTFGNEGPHPRLIRSVDFTPNREGDILILPDLLDQIAGDEQRDSVIADVTFDTHRCHSAIRPRKAVPIFQMS